MPTSTPTVFAERLRDKRLVDSAHLDSLSDLAARFPDAPALAHELVRRGWLTEYQADALLQDRVQDLVRGPYRLLEPLGEGAMGQVFKARHAETDGVVALKLLLNKEAFANPRAMQRFTREVRAAALLNHPHIVRATDANLVGDTPYLAMEFVDGADLSQRVKRDGPLPVPLACEYARQASLAL